MKQPLFLVGGHVEKHNNVVVEISEDGFAYLPGYILESLPDGNNYAFVFDLNGSTYTTSFFNKADWPLATDQQINLCEQGLIKTSASITQSRNKTAFKLYPNPSSGIITFENIGSENISIQVIDITGKHLNTHKVQQTKLLCTESAEV